LKYLHIVIPDKRCVIPLDSVMAHYKESDDYVSEHRALSVFDAENQMRVLAENLDAIDSFVSNVASELKDKKVLAFSSKYKTFNPVKSKLVGMYERGEKLCPLDGLVANSFSDNSFLKDLSVNSQNDLFQDYLMTYMLHSELCKK